MRSSARTGLESPRCSTCWSASSFPTAARSPLMASSVLGRKPHEINQMGINRVFQTPEIFSDLTVLENVLIPCFAKRDGAYRMHAFERVGDEADVIDRAEAMLVDVKMEDKRHMHSGNLRAATSGDLKWRCASFRSHVFCCWTSPPPAWPGPTPTTRSNFLRRSRRSAPSRWRSSNTTCMSSSAWLSASPFSRRARPWSRTSPRKSKGHPKVQEAYLGSSEA